MNNDFEKKMADIQRRIPDLVRRLPGIAKIEGLKFINDNFRAKGFADKKGSVKKWKERKPTKDKRKGRQLLIDSGALRRSWDSDTKTTANTVEFTSQQPYAEAHNEGLKAGRPPGFTMPERRMIGKSEELNSRIEAKFDELTKNVFE